MPKLKKDLLDFYNVHKRMPSFSELMRASGYRSKSAVSYAIDQLIEEGVMKKDHQGRLIPLKLGGIKLLGLVEAGFPSPAEEELTDTISLDEYLIEDPESTYLLKVKGDSMINAGIHCGDLIIAKRGADYQDGDIVVAEVDGEWTVKYFKKGRNKPYLMPANDEYRSIYPQQELKVSAVVKAVIRKY